MDSTLLILLVLVGLSILYLAIFKKQLVFGIISGIIFIVCGLMSWNGIKYVSSTTITTVNSSLVNITDVYSVWSHSFGSGVFNYGNVIGTLLILVGLFLVLVFSVSVFSGEKTGSGDIGNNEYDE